MGKNAHFVPAGFIPQGTPSEGGGETGFTTVYVSSAAPSFRAGGCYLYLNDIIAFPPARVLPDGKTRIRHLARIERSRSIRGTDIRRVTR